MATVVPNKVVRGTSACIRLKEPVTRLLFFQGGESRQILVLSDQRVEAEHCVQLLLEQANLGTQG